MLLNSGCGCMWLCNRVLSSVQSPLILSFTNYEATIKCSTNRETIVCATIVEVTEFGQRIGLEGTKRWKMVKGIAFAPAIATLLPLAAFSWFYWPLGCCCSQILVHFCNVLYPFKSSKKCTWRWVSLIQFNYYTAVRGTTHFHFEHHQ